MRTCVLVIFCVLTLNSVWADSSRVEEALKTLDNILANRETYFNSQASKIDSLKIIARQIPKSDVASRFDILHDIFREYCYFQGDSAYRYAQLTDDMAHQTGSADNIVKAHTDLLFSHLSSGNFTDAVEIVNKTDLTGVSDETKSKFYYTCIRLFSDLAAYTDNVLSDQYDRRSFLYCDSVMMTASPDSYEYGYALAFSPKSENTPQHRLKVFKQMLNRNDIDLDTKALLSSLVADAFRDLKMTDSLIYYKANAARLDTEAAKRETIATLDLGTILFNQGDIERAYRYIELAREDAEFFNMRSRKMQINGILPLVEKSRYMALEGERKALLTSTIIFVVMAALLIAAIIYIVIQLRKVRRLKAESDKKSGQLEEINGRLKQTVERLEESNKIKEEYIGYGFSVHADYTRRLEHLYNMVDRRLMMKQYDELRKSLKQSDIRKDKEQMFARFDSSFLRIFPTFIAEWDKLFPEGESKSPDISTGTLTSEMRIFALMRLGITEINDISVCLGYSVNTINTYKTKVKNRSHLPNDRFEAAIMRIGT